MQTGDRQNPPSQARSWFATEDEALPRISPQDLKAMDALFKNVDPESVESDLSEANLQAPSELIEWELVNLIA
jgi:hypothetical protein